ncbi:STAS domain-containing protein [Streptosporangium sp. NBC_01755]|uniref:STAS domain-containing protein n=1 Tax=unclassified Streptosporangium TaxID=2632669 RepID=UPI002DD96335|nr:MULTISPECIES: STAS domain-containing protein [unclassified Streptosporangium]WSA25246.1 STAS domain-containing protein [Streptosporangium sp. NBC_01810]WSD03437.1 STAS domain-containing protein [Streptosporangium sp. NBC_01755]
MSTAVRVTYVSDPSAKEMVLLSLAGELDYANAERFYHDLHQAIGQDRVDLVVDLTDLTFCDSIGIQQFLNTRKTVLSRGGSIVLVNPYPRLERILHLTGLTHAFGIQPTVADAVKVLRPRQSS